MFAAAAAERASERTRAVGNTASPAGVPVRSLLGCSSVWAEPETETLASVVSALEGKRDSSAS